MGRPRLLDSYCKAGGATRGYQLAGFEVTGVDLEPQPNYIGDHFVLGDALDYIKEHGHEYDAHSASPPCQRYSQATPAAYRGSHADLYEPTRELLIATGRPWVIENVIGAPYRSGFVLCGSMFGLKVRRHRNFETSFAVLAPQCRHKEQGQPFGVHGTGGGGVYASHNGVKASPRDYAELMEMPWATPAEIAQAVPPAYTRWLGERLSGEV